MKEGEDVMFSTKKLVQLFVMVMIFGTISFNAFAVTETTTTTETKTTATTETTKNKINPADIQKALTEAGYYKGPVDGVIGSKTKEALRKFQEANNLKADGVCGPKTWEKLKTYKEGAAGTDASKTAETSEITTTPSLDESSSSDSTYSEYDSSATQESDSGALKQKLVS